jgi:hypothetical protein
MGGGKHLPQMVEASTVREHKRETSVSSSSDVVAVVSVASVYSSLAPDSKDSVTRAPVIKAPLPASASLDSGCVASVRPLLASDCKDDVMGATAVAGEIAVRVPASFVVCGYDLGYQNTGLAMLALYSAWMCVELVTMVRLAIAVSGFTSPFYIYDLASFTFWTILLSMSRACLETVVQVSTYRRLIDTPHRRSICMAMGAGFVATYVWVLHPSWPMFFGVLGINASIITTAATFDYVGQHAKHLKLDKLEFEYERYVRDSCRRAAAAWNIKDIVYVGKLPPDPDAFAYLRRATRNAPLLMLPPSFTGALTVRLTAPFAYGECPEPFRIFLSGDVSTIACTTSYIEAEAYRRMLVDAIESAQNCRTKLGLTTLAVENTETTLPSGLAAVISVLQCSAISGPKVVQQLSTPVTREASSPSGSLHQPSGSPHQPHRHLIVRANTEEPKTSVTINGAGIVQITVQLGSLDSETTIRQLLREYVAYET